MKSWGDKGKLGDCSISSF